MSVLSFISSIFNPAAKLIDSLHVSAEEKGKLKNELAKIQSEMQKESIKLMTAEASSEHKLTSMWRPVCSLILFTLILLDGFNFIEAPQQVYDLAATFLSVYGGGRSLEKVAKVFKK